MISTRQLLFISVAVTLIGTKISHSDTLMDALNLAYSGNPSLQASRG